MPAFINPCRGAATRASVAVFFLALGLAAPASALASDRWVAPSGADSGDCSLQASPCQSIAYALTQVASGETVRIAAGTYEAPLSISTDGVQLIGEDANDKPLLTRFAGSTNQPLLVIDGAKNVRVENLDFGMDQSFVAEGILASGFVDGLAIVGNHFGSSRSSPADNSSFGYRNAISINDVRNSQSLPRVDGSAVTIDGNVIDGIGDAVNGVVLRAGVNMDAGVGTISNNTIAAGTHDIHVRFASVVALSSADNVIIDGNTLAGRGLEFDAPNATTAAVVISNNIVSAPPGLDPNAVYPADWSLARLEDNQQYVPVTLSGNLFQGHTGTYRGVLLENFPGAVLSGNTFTPAAAASDFVSLVISNKEINTDNPPEAPYALSVLATGNTFNASSGAADVGTAVEFLDDNDAAGSATYGSLVFGGSGAGEANAFDGDLREYFRLDDYSCSTNTAAVGATAGGAGPPCDFLDYAGVGTLPNTEVRPFAGNVSAADNLYAGLAPAAMTPAQQNDLLARTYDKAANPALGSVDYALTATQPVVYVDDDFTGSGYGDAVSFTSAAAACPSQTAYFGVNAFASVVDGLAHVQSGGRVCVAKGDYPAALNLASQPVQIVGDGNGASDSVLGAVSVSVSGASQADPLLLQNLRVSNAGGNGVAVSGASHLAFEQVAFAGNGGSGLDFGNADDVVIGASLFDANGGAGIRTGTASHVSHVVISDSVLSNNAAGIILFGASASGNGQILDWRIDNSQFLANNDDSNGFGGGLWLKTGGAGSAIDGFVVTGSTFADNGSSNTLNRVGITVRARPDTTMQRVFICANTFSDTASGGTQLTGINVFDDSDGYQPITVCASNTFDGLGHSVSGLEQHNLRGTEPTVDIIGGSIANTEYINAVASVALTLNGPAATVAGTPTPGYTAQLSNTGSALIENVLVDFVLSRPGGLAAGDATLEYDTGSGFAAIPLDPCGSDLCGSFGPPGTGFAVASAYNAITDLRFTSLRSGTVTIAASVDGVESQASYAASSGTISVAAAAAASIAADSDTSISGMAGTGATPLPAVKVSDAYGNPVSGYGVVFAAGADSGLLSASSPTTGADGVATLGGWTFGTASTETVTASGSTMLAGAPVTFTASVAANLDLAVSFSSAPDYVEYGKTVDYVIVVNNVGPSTATSLVTDNLPAEFDPDSASWICFAHTAGASCSASGSGGLSDTPTIPAGGSVTYVLSATVLAAPADDTVLDQATVDVGGDGNPSNNTASSSAAIVIFRDGFESDAGPAPGAQHAGTLDDAATLVLDPAAAPVADAPQPWLGAYDAHGRVVFRIESLRGSGPPLVRIVGSDADGRESHGAWLALAGHKAALALATTPAKAHAVILLGAGDASLQATLPSWVTLPLQVDVAQ
jgi:uncharacterized repeat protein (TIGR01451 family)